MAVTLTNLIDRAKQLADLVGSEFVSSAEWTTWTNSGMFELYDMVVSAYEDYFTISQALTITTGNTVALPASFYKLRGVDYSIGTNTYVNVTQFNFKDRNADSTWVLSVNGSELNRKYRLVADNLEIIPADRAPGSYQIWYIPALTPLASGSDTLASTLSKFGWEEYIVLYAAIKAKTKGEEDTTDCLNQLNALSQRIISMTANRNADQPERITNLAGLDYTRGSGYPFD